MTTPPSPDYNKHLLLAAERGNLARVKVALESGAEIDTVDTKTTRTALGESSFNGHLSVVQHLVDAGANPYLPYNARTPRDWALTKQHVHIASYLETTMKLPKWINRCDETDGLTLLTRSIDSGQLTKTELFIEWGADVCLLDDYGKSPLKYAIEKDYLDIVKKLLSKGAIATGVSALNYAFTLKKNGMLKCLVNTNGLMVDAFLFNGYTPLTKSLATNNLEIAKLLIENGANPTKVDRNNNHPLQQALELNFEGIFKLLVLVSKCQDNHNEGGAINSYFPDGYSPLTKAIYTYRMEFAKFLIGNGANPEKVDRNGNIPLELALELNFVEMAEVLIVKGVKVPKKIEETLFHKLAKNGNIGVYRFLVKSGWDVNQIDENGKSTLGLAASNDNVSLSKLLIEEGSEVGLAKAETDAFRLKNCDFAAFLQEFEIQKKEGPPGSMENGQE